MEATALNYTITTDRMSERGFSCWWEIKINQTRWDASETKIKIYIA